MQESGSAFSPLAFSPANPTNGNERSPATAAGETGFSADRPPARTLAADRHLAAEGAGLNLQDTLEAELGPATPPQSADGISESDALLELATLKVARACRDVVDDARIEFLESRVKDPAKLAENSAAFDGAPTRDAGAERAGEPAGNGAAAAAAKERSAKPKRFARVAMVGVALLAATALTAGRNLPVQMPDRWLARADAWLPGFALHLPEAWTSAIAAERTDANRASLRDAAGEAALPAQDVRFGSVTVVGEESAGEDRIWRANLSDRLTPDVLPPAADDRQAARIAELEMRLKLLESQAQKIRDGSAIETEGGDAALSGAIARDKAEIAMLRQADDGEPPARAALKQDPPVAAPLRASPRSSQAVELAFAEVKALAALPASGRRDLKDRLVAGECLATALKAVADPVPVLLMRDLVRQLDSEC
jgi:hypothetical protein